MQTYITQAAAGFLPESSSTARDIGYQVECAPTLKAGGKSSAVMLPTLCLNDQGGQAMDYSEEVSGTLRAQEHGHQPLVFENHGIDARYPQYVMTGSDMMQKRNGVWNINLPEFIQAQGSIS